MKNLLKARIAPLLGITVCVAVIGLLTACFGPGEEEDIIIDAPSQKPVIEAPYGTFVGIPLYATYPGTENVIFMWYKSTDTIAGEGAVEPYSVEDKFIPTEAGGYVVVAIDAGAINAAGGLDAVTAFGYSKCEGVAGVQARPGYGSFLGEWFMKGSDNNYTYGDETVIISDKSFKLDATAEDDDGNAEFLYFVISDWTELTDTEVTEANAGTGYTIGYKLDYSSVTENGYPGWANTGSFRLLLNETGSQFEVKRTAASGTAVLPRIYKKQPF